MSRHNPVILWASALAFAMLACALGGGTTQPPTEVEPTESETEPLNSADVEATAYFASLTATAQARATQDQLQALTSTAFFQEQDATAQARIQGEQQTSADATATAQPITAELSALGIGEGELAWVHPPLTLSVEGHLQYDYANNFLQEFVPEDFVMSGDITWNTTTGLAGCGFALRSNGDTEALNQYIVILSRAGNGAVNFIVQSSTVISGANTRSLGTGADPQFQSQNDAANRLTVVARGGAFTFYTNGTEVGTIADNTYQSGYVALIALSESGTTTCTFNNTWLWLLDN